MPQTTFNSSDPQTLDLPSHLANTVLAEFYQQGNNCALANEHLQGIEHYNRALEIYPDCVEIYCARGQSFIELKRYPEAKNDYLAVLKINHNFAIAYGGLAQVYYGFRDYDTALIECERAIERDRANINFYRTHAMISNKLGDRHQVLIDCRIVLERLPNDTSARWLNGVAHFHLGNYKVALFNFTQYLQLRANDFYAYYYRGLCQEQLDDPQQAIADLNSAIDLNNNQALVYRKRGRIYQRLGDLTAAMADFDRAIEIDPHTAQTYCYRADIHISRGDYVQALMQSSQAISLNSQLVSAYYQRGVIHTEVGNLHAALADYNRLIQLNPLDLNAYLQRSWIYFRHGEYPEVMKDCEYVLTIDATSIPANYLLGVVRSLSGLKQEAIYSFTRTLDYAPGFVCALYHRGLLRYDLKDENRAMDDFKFAQEIQTTGLDSISNRDETGLYAEGLALYHMGQPETAKVILSQAAVVANKLRSIPFNRQITFTLEALGMS